MSEDPTEEHVGSASELAECTNCDELQDQVSQLTAQLEKLQSKIKKEEKQGTELTAQLEKAKVQIQSKNKKTRELRAKKVELEKQLAKEQEQHKRFNETAKAKEEQFQTQIQALFKQVEKFRAVLKERDSEMQQLQEEILAKNEAEAKTSPRPIRTIVTDQDTVTQDTTVLRRRVNDLEMELQHLKQALEKDPKYRIYLLVRETGQRTLEELSKVLGVGIFEARRRVQELVRGGLLTLKDEKVLLARR